jgi:hypothetical protein
MRYYQNLNGLIISNDNSCKKELNILIDHVAGFPRPPHNFTTINLLLGLLSSLGSTRTSKVMPNERL